MILHCVGLKSLNLDWINVVKWRQTSPFRALISHAWRKATYLGWGSEKDINVSLKTLWKKTTIVYALFPMHAACWTFFLSNTVVFGFCIKIFINTEKLYFVLFSPKHWDILCENRFLSSWNPSMHLYLNYVHKSKSSQMKDIAH